MHNSRSVAASTGRCAAESQGWSTSSTCTGRAWCSARPAGTVTGRLLTITTTVGCWWSPGRDDVVPVDEQRCWNRSRAAHGVGVRDCRRRCGAAATSNRRPCAACLCRQSWPHMCVARVFLTAVTHAGLRAMEPLNNMQMVCLLCFKVIRIDQSLLAADFRYRWPTVGWQWCSNRTAARAACLESIGSRRCRCNCRLRRCRRPTTRAALWMTRRSPCATSARPPMSQAFTVRPLTLPVRIV